MFEHKTHWENTGVTDGYLDYVNVTQKLHHYVQTHHKEYSETCHTHPVVWKVLVDNFTHDRLLHMQHVGSEVQYDIQHAGLGG